MNCSASSASLVTILGARNSAETISESAFHLLDHVLNIMNPAESTHQILKGDRLAVFAGRDDFAFYEIVARFDLSFREVDDVRYAVGNVG